MKYNIMKYLPKELVNIIADFHDYEKYCKPVHKIKYEKVLDDIINMGDIMNTISPIIAKECWGPYKPHWFDGTQEEWFDNQYVSSLSDED